MARLVAKSPELAGQIYELDSPLLTFGRAEDNVLCIPHSSISSHHGEFKLDGGDYRLTDTGSTNGSKVNDTPVTDRLLRNGDLVLLGNALFAYESDAPVSNTPAAPPPLAGERIELGLNQSGLGRPASFVNLVAIGKPAKITGAKLPPLLIAALVIFLAGAAYLVYATLVG
ncbi:MAG: FHA domain-containing protein [Verrucomicrobiales bacterium]|jgi:hypothetical protein|nr:FHA domain-containing protein [Verrucomicrobiales bacterium]